MTASRPLTTALVVLLVALAGPMARSQDAEPVVNAAAALTNAPVPPAAPAAEVVVPQAAPAAEPTTNAVVSPESPATNAPVPVAPQTNAAAPQAAAVTPPAAPPAPINVITVSGKVQDAEGHGLTGVVAHVEYAAEPPVSTQTVVDTTFSFSCSDCSAIYLAFEKPGFYRSEDYEFRRDSEAPAAAASVPFTTNVVVVLIPEEPVPAPEPVPVQEEPTEAKPADPAP